MKLRNMVAYIKRKQFYLALFACCVTLILIAVVVWTRPNNNTEIANLNDPPKIQEDNEILIEELVENPENIVEAISVTDKPIMNNEDDFNDDNTDTTNEEPEEDVKDVEQTVTIIVNPKPPNLAFNDNESMIWPVNGDILMPFSVDTPIYFKTLEQFRTNTALFISGTLGEGIKASADGIVENIEFDHEIGTTVTIYHGNGWKSKYGQLSEKLNVEKGETIRKGKIIGYIEEPTKFYVLLEPHLFFKVTKNEIPIDPKEMITE